MLIIVTVPPSLSMTIMICTHTSGIIISSITIIIDVPTTSTGIAFDERLEKHPHLCRQRRHTGSEIGFEERPRRRIFEKLAELALDLITLTVPEIAQPVKRLDDAHRWSPGPEQLTGRGRTEGDRHVAEFDRTATSIGVHAEVLQQVVHMTLHEKPPNATHWSLRSMATAADISYSSVQRIWRAHGLKPHLVDTFKVSRDKNFAAKVEDVVGLYLNPPDKALVLCVDEKSQIQALDRTQPGLPMKKGRAGTMTHDYKRNGTTTLFAALNMLDGKVIGACMPRHRHREFLRFLKLVDQQTPTDLDLHLIVDNYATHKTPAVKRWIKAHPRFHLHFADHGLVMLIWHHVVRNRGLPADALMRICLRIKVRIPRMAMQKPPLDPDVAELRHRVCSDRLRRRASGDLSPAARCRTAMAPTGKRSRKSCCTSIRTARLIAPAGLGKPISPGLAG